MYISKSFFENKIKITFPKVLFSKNDITVSKAIDEASSIGYP